MVFFDEIKRLVKERKEASLDYEIDATLEYEFKKKQKALGNLVKKLREEQNLTFIALADKSEIQATEILKLEHGTHSTHTKKKTENYLNLLELVLLTLKCEKVVVLMKELHELEAKIWKKK